MNNLIITQVPPKNQPTPGPRPLAPSGIRRPHCYRIRKEMPVDFDPGRRLIAAVLLTAVTDRLWPRRDLSRPDRESAVQFLASEDAAHIIRALDLPLARAQQLLLPERCPELHHLPPVVHGGEPVEGLVEGVAS